MTETSQPPFHSGFVAIIGRPNVGKSTLLNRLVGQKIAITSNKPQTTRNRILGIHHLDDGQILFLDTPGIHQARGRLNRFMVEQALGACAEVDLVLFLIAANERPRPAEEEILSQLAQRRRPVFLVINKLDTVRPERLLPLIDHYARKFPFAEVLPVSGLNGDGVPQLVAAIRARLPIGPRYYAEEMVTDQSERFIVGELVREQVMRQTHNEIPYRTAVVIEQFSEQPERNLVVIHATIMVERDSHKGIVLGKGGAMIRTIGRHARHEVERLLGCRVFLELFVRVQPGWTESDRLLKDFGYH